MPYTLIKTGSDQEFVETSVKWLADRIHKSIQERGACIIGLSGGSTPKPIYEALGKEKIDWSRVSFFLTDERYVPANDKDSNQQMIRETLLKGMQIPSENIVFPRTDLPIEKCMEDYALRLKEQWSEHLPDIVTLGLGNDGHIASLFPPLNDEALGDERLLLHTTTNLFAGHDRISLSLNTLAAANAHLFLMKGEEKKHVWDEMLASEEDERRWPAKRIVEQPDVTSIVQW